MTIPVLAALFVAFTPQATPADGGRTEVETLKSLCTRLSKETGKVVEAERSLSGMPIFVDRRSMTPAEVMDGVAFGFHATVIPTKQGWRIARTSDDRKEMLSRVRQLWRERLDDWFIEYGWHVKEAAHQGDASAQYSYYQAIVGDQLRRLQKEGPFALPNVSIDPSEVTPLGALYMGAVQNIGVDRLIDIRPDERRLWSNLPDDNQSSCPRGAALLDAYAQAERLFRSKRDTGEPYSEPARFVLKQVGGLSFDLHVYDGTGKQIGRYAGGASLSPMAGPIAINSSALAAPYGKDASSWRKLDALTAQSRPFLGFPGIVKPLPKNQLPEAIVHPDQCDPLDFSVRLGLAAIAESNAGKGFVAVPTDDLLETTDACIVDGQMNVAGFSHLLENRWQFERPVHNGITVLRLTDPFRAMNETVDRTNLASETRTLLSLAKIDGTDLAASYYHLYPQIDSRVASRVFTDIVRCQPHHRSNALSSSSFELCWIGAALAATRGATGTVSIDAKNEPFKSLINLGVNSNRLVFESAAKMPDSKIDAAAIAGSFAFSPRMTVETSRVPVLVNLGVNPQTGMDPDDLGLDLPEQVGRMFGAFNTVLPKEIYDAHPELLPGRDEMVKKIQTFGAYHVGVKLQLAVTLFPFNGVRSRIGLEEQTVTQTNLAFDDLPDDMRKAILDNAMRYIEEFKAGKQTLPLR